MPVQQVKQMTTSSEFQMWMIYLNEEPNKFNALYFYLAQIAAEVRRSVLTKESAKKVSTKDFLITFVSEEEKEKSDIKNKAEQSKSSWLQWLGLNRKKNNGRS